MGRRVSRSVGFVVGGQPQDKRLAGLVQAYDIDLRPLAAKLQDDTVERVNGGQVPEVCLGDVDANGLDDLPEVEGLGEGAG